jgi:DNA polymerase III alpha subunit
MNYDSYGQVLVTTDDLFELLYKNPDLDLTKFNVTDPYKFNDSVKSLYYPGFRLAQSHTSSDSIEEFDRKNQQQWFMPDSYCNLDIEQWLLNQCKTELEINRVQQELVLYQERNLLSLLRYLKFFIDTLRKHNIVWGVGRGSSVSSYVLYLIGVHRINSIQYELDIGEFLK